MTEQDYIALFGTLSAFDWSAVFCHPVRETCSMATQRAIATGLG